MPLRSTMQRLAPRARFRHPRRCLAAFLATLALAACGDSTGPLPRDGAPDALEFSIGGFGTGSAVVLLRDDHVLLWRTPWDAGFGFVADTVRVAPAPDAWRAFWAAADRAGVHRWRRRYTADVVDGEGWTLRLVAGDRRIESAGNNAYPDRLGFEHELERTDEFRAFIAAVGELVGQPLERLSP